MRRIAVLAWFAACSGDSIGLGELPDALLDARCSYLVRCGLVASSSDCRAYFERTAFDDPNPAAAVSAGKLAYNAEAAQRCIDAIETASCDSTTMSARKLAPPCEEIYTGRTKTGEACVFDAQCESRSCVTSSCTMACCTGTCAPGQPLAEVDQSCANVDCVTGAYCGADDICHALLPAGAVCDDPRACDYDLACVASQAMTSGTCKALPKLDEPCPDMQCAEVGAVCKNGTCVKAGVFGDACASGVDCSFFYTCDATMTCALHPTRGMPCTFTCSDDSWCNMGTCDAQKPNGSTCLRNDECATHFCERIATSQGTCKDVPLCF